MIYVMLIAAGVCAIGLQIVFVSGRRLFASAGTCFITIQTLFWAGTVIAVDPDQPYDMWWLLVVSGGMLCFALGGAACNRLHRFRPAHETGEFLDRPARFDLGSRRISAALLLAAIACVIVGVLHAGAVGYHVTLTALRDFLNTGVLDPSEYSSLRVAISTDRYVASGYVAQFTAVLLPIIICMLYFRVRVRRSMLVAALLAIAIAADMYFLSLTGGRAWLIYAVGGFLLLVSPAGPVPADWKKVQKAFWTSVVALACLYASLAIVMNRTEANGATATETATAIAREFLGRTITDEATGHLELMRYFLTQPVAHGRQWWEDMEDMLHISDREFTSGTEMYAIIHAGDTGGSMGLTLWGSLAYNWGTGMAFVLAFLTGMALQAFTISYVRGPKDLGRTIVLFLAGTRLATVRDPYSLCLNGFVTATLFYFLIHVVEHPPVLTRRRRVSGLSVADSAYQTASTSHSGARSVADTAVHDSDRDPTPARRD